MPKRKQPVAAPAPPKAQGTGKKRTPQSSFDPAAGKDVYESLLARTCMGGGLFDSRISGMLESNDAWVGRDNRDEWTPARISTVGAKCDCVHRALWGLGRGRVASSGAAPPTHREAVGTARGMG